MLINADEWWVERRIVSRHFAEKNQSNTAYKLVSDHSAQSPSAIIDAEFHAGWYALRNLNNQSLARKHFERLLRQATIPSSIARGYYWLGRASKKEKARHYFQKAARHRGTFYGQLAAAKLGTSNLKISRPSPSTTERQHYKRRELVRAIKRLESIKHQRWANVIYLHLAKILPSKGELALLAADAEKQGNMRLSLQVGKIANKRGFDVDTLSWPIGAIPNHSKLKSIDHALAYAIARQESEFNKAAVSSANARGIMQVLPKTAKAVARRNGLTYSYQKLTLDAAYNAALGTAYFNEQLERFEGSLILAFAAYNAGPQRTKEWLVRFGDPRGKSLDYVVD